MLKVIGAGLPRTGTTSMKAALERLGFGPCYHMFEIITNPDHVDRWLPALSGPVDDWDRVLAGYRSTQDWPAAHYWRELAETYPEAKVVLTVRDPRTWYPSFRTLLSRGSAVGDVDTGELPVPARRMMAAMGRLRPVLDMIGSACFGPDWRFGDDPGDEERAVRAFERHVETVRGSLPAERLLVFDVREGWEPLCSFLGVTPPAGEPFPHLNDSEWMRRALERMRSGGRMPSPFDGGRRG